MPKNLLGHLTKIERDELFDAMNYMNMEEIKTFCNKHDIPTEGKKGPVLDRIKHYLLTGEILQSKNIPAISKSKSNRQHPLSPNTLILYGSYKNDLKTRKFFKNILGEHFHFTAFGQDWILNRWQQGKPPTYGAFAKAWQKEYLKRKGNKANPRKEWAYLNFMQRFLEHHPKATKSEFAAAWKKERSKQAKKAIRIINEATRLSGRSFS